MALGRRLLRLLQADMHGVLDRLEAPEVLLKQALREMEEALDRDAQVIKRLVRENEGLSLRLQELAQSRASVEQELDLCFETENETLARTLLKRRLETEKMSGQLLRRQEELDTELRERRTQLTENRNRYESVRQKAEMLGTDSLVGSGGVDDWPSSAVTVRDVEVDIALLKEKQRRSPSGRQTPDQGEADQRGREAP